MKKIVFVILSNVLLTNLQAQSCIENKVYKVDKVFVSVDSMKMRYPFQVDVKSDSTTVYIKIDTPGEPKEIFITIKRIEKCDRPDSLSYSSVFYGTIKNEDMERSVTDDEVETKVVFEKKGLKYYMKMIVPQFENAEFEIFMQEKIIKNAAKKH